MPQEIERTFLVEDHAWRDRTRDDGTDLAQGYLHVGDDSSIRVRLRGDDEAVLTVKRGTGMARAEVEVPIGREEATRLLEEAIIGEVVRKRRHEVPLHDDLVAEVDVFAGPLDGLVLVEVELPDEDMPLDPPPWFGEEVTDDPRYGNARLATDGRPDR